MRHPPPPPPPTPFMNEPAQGSVRWDGRHSSGGPGNELSESSGQGWFFAQTRRTADKAKQQKNNRPEAHADFIFNRGGNRSRVVRT